MSIKKCNQAHRIISCFYVKRTCETFVYWLNIAIIISHCFAVNNFVWNITTQVLIIVTPQTININITQQQSTSKSWWSEQLSKRWVILKRYIVLIFGGRVQISLINVINNRFVTICNWFKSDVNLITLKCIKKKLIGGFQGLQISVINLFQNCFLSNKNLHLYWLKNVWCT